MEQNTSNNSSNTSPPTKKTKVQLEEQLSSPGTTSNQSVSTAENLTAAKPENNQQPSNITTAENLSQLNNGNFDFILPSEEESARASEENPDPNSAGLANSRTGGVWNSSREEAHSAQVQERSLLGHLITLKETQKKILEADIFRILESEGVTEIGALYKVSPSKFVLVFGSQAAKEKLQNTEIQCRFGDSDLRLSFYKRVGPLRNGREPIFATVFLPELVSDQAVRLTFSNFGEVVTVFKGRHKFNRSVRNGRRHVKIFPAGGDPAILPRKITFHGRIQRDVLFAEKVVLCYRCKTRHMLGENCPVVTPAQEDSSMSVPEQSGVAVGSAALVQRESSTEIQSSTESQQASSPTCEEGEEGVSSGKDGSTSGSDSDSTSESDDGDESDSVPSRRSVAPSDDSPDLPSRENVPAIQGAQADEKQDSHKPEAVSSSKENQTNSKPQTMGKQGSQTKYSTVPLRSLMNFPYPEIFYRWYRESNDFDIFKEAIDDLGIKGTEKYLNSLVEILHIAADLIREHHATSRDQERFKESITNNRNLFFCDTPPNERPSISKFDSYLFSWGVKVWPHALDLIKKYERRRNLVDVKEVQP